MSTKNNEDGLRILKAEINNFKNISFKEVEFDGRSVIIAGPNQAGKSSFIQAVTSPVNSKMIPLEPIKKGEQRASIQLLLGGKLHGKKEQYHVGLYFTPEHSRGKLTLEDSDGNPIKGGEKKILSDLIGDISFDIMEFVRMGQTETGKSSKEGVRKQIEILKSLMPDQDVKMLTDLDIEKEKIYNERTEINREIKFYKSQIEKSGLSQDEIDLYSEPKSSEVISEKIQKANKKNDSIEKASSFIRTSANDLADLEADILSFEEKIRIRKKQIAEINEKKIACEEFLKKNPNPIDISKLNEEFNTLAAHNANHEKVKELEKTTSELRSQEQKADSITERLKEIDTEKKNVFSNSKMPVKGLEFDDENILFRGLPLSEGNVPTSQLIGIGTKIGMALNPNLRLLVIRDGSLLDNKTLNFILKACEEKGYQLLIEMVKSDGEGVSIDFIEK